MYPSSETMNPEPRLLRFCSLGILPKKLFQNSSKGSCWPKGERIRGRLNRTTCVVLMLTTAGETSLNRVGMSTGSIRTDGEVGTAGDLSLFPRNNALLIGDRLNAAEITSPAATAASTRMTTLLFR